MIGASFLRHSYVQDALEQVMQGILRTKKLYYIYIYLIRLLVGFYCIIIIIAKETHNKIRHSKQTNPYKYKYINSLLISCRMLVSWGPLAHHKLNIIFYISSKGPLRI